MLSLAKERTLNHVKQSLEESKSATLEPFEKQVREAKNTAEMVRNLQRKLDAQDSLDLQITNLL